MPAAIWINGKILSKETALISVYDHGLLYGDGVFEGIRTYRGQAFRLQEHMQRLYESARAIWLEVPYPIEHLTKAVHETVKASAISDGYVRLIVTRGAGALGLDPRKTANPQVIVMADEITIYPRESYEKGLKIVTASTIRNHPAALNPRIKSLNYLNNIMAKIEGILAGCSETLMLNHKGEVSECTGDNIFIIKGRTLITPPIDAGILDGVTRRVTMELGVEAGLNVLEAAMTRHDVYTADECFLTGTAAELIPVVDVDGRKIGIGTPGSIYRDLRERFDRMIAQG